MKLLKIDSKLGPTYSGGKLWSKQEKKENFLYVEQIDFLLRNETPVFSL